LQSLEVKLLAQESKCLNKDEESTRFKNKIEEHDRTIHNLKQ
jgi:hypothetical protein